MDVFLAKINVISNLLYLKTTDQSEEGKLKGELEKCLAESKEWKERV